MTANPLAKYFRKPGMYVTLPSKGKFTKPEDIQFSITGEVEVFPMTAADEIISKNPDGLLNGHSVEKILKSCVPGIKDPMSLPTQDVDYLLLAIKKVSSGDIYEISRKCPHCGNDHGYSISLEEKLNEIIFLNDDYSVRINDEVIIHLKPHTYASTTKMALAAFEETKMFQSMMDNELSSDDKIKYFNESYEKIASLQLDIMSECVYKVITPEDEVVNHEFIKQFILNTDSKTISKIKDKLSEIGKSGIDYNITLDCECGKEFDTSIILDPSHFFD